MTRCISSLRAQLLNLSLLAVIALGAIACSAAQLETDDFNDPASFRIGSDATVEDTDVNRQVLMVVKAYRDGMANRNGSAVRQLIADEYYENGSTTSDRTDDYGNEKIDELLGYYLGEKVREVRYDMEIKQVLSDNAFVHVDYEYYWSFRYVADGRDHWEAKRDVNRLTLIEEDGSWKIAGGL